MNRVDHNSLISIATPINYDINKSLERKCSLDLTIGLLVAVKICCCGINRVFANIRRENKTLLESFELLSDFSNRLCETTEILN